MTRIELHQLSKTYTRNTAPVVNRVCLRVEPHQLLALLGPSGSGKSTILKLIAGIEAPDSGDIQLDGQSVLALPAHQRGAVLMFQKAYLFPFLTVGENIAFGLRARKIAKSTIEREVQRMLDLVGLPGMAQRKPAQLSGGEQQRIALARALVIQPRVLLLDEPFSSLDPAVRQTLQESVRNIQRDLGITTILVTHDRSEALSMADHIALLERGTLIAHDTPRRLYERPPTRHAARQMGIETFLRGTLNGQVLHCALGAITVPASDQPNGDATFAIRPEHIRLLTQPAPEAIAAEVQAYTFRGDHGEYQLAIGSETVRVRVYQPVGTMSGQVYIHFPAEYLFPVFDGV